MMDAGKGKILAIIVSVLALISSLKWLLAMLASGIVDHNSMKKVKEMTQQKSSIPIEKQHYTANDQPAQTKVTRRVPARKHALPKRMINTPLTNIFVRTKTGRSTSKARPPIIKKKTKKDNIINRMFILSRKKRSTSRVHPVGKVEDHCIDDRFGDVPT